MPKSEPKQNLLIVLLVIVALVFFWSAISPRDRFTWLLEVFPVILAVPLLLIIYRRFPLTTLAYVLITLHAIILMIGGHYTYAHVPPFNWLRDLFDFSRNHYDRLGHFAQGFIPAILTRELLLRTSPLRPGKWLFVLVVGSCLAISAVYELIEWAVAAATGAAAEAFLGTQGDIWDTQKDMLLAMIGAVAALVFLGKWHDRQLASLAAKVDQARDFAS